MNDRYTAPRKTNNSPLARIRMDRGLTQGQLAELIGCPQQNVSRWEQGTRSPGMKSLMKLAQALECKVDELLAY